jgi:hypothetical protein
MSTDKTIDGFEFSCDVCRSEVWSHRGSDKPEFMDCWNEAKAEGWRCRAVKGSPKEWEHKCPSCNWPKESKE